MVYSILLIYSKFQVVMHSFEKYIGINLNRGMHLVNQGHIQGVFDGWSFMLNHLSPSKRELHFARALRSTTVIPTLTNTNPRFATDTIYHLFAKMNSMTFIIV